MKRLKAEPISDVQPFSKEAYKENRTVGMRGQGRRKHRLSGQTVHNVTPSKKPVGAKALRKNTKRARKAAAHELLAS